MKRIYIRILPVILLTMACLLPNRHQAIAEDAAPANALGAASCWETFVGHLRAGRMVAAYACFSPLSRKVFSYEDFCAHYNPMTATGEAILSPLSAGQFRLSGDLAHLQFIATPSMLPSSTPELEQDTSRPDILVRAMIIREKSRWYLVASAREATARIEAEMRNLLRRLWQHRSVQALARTKTPTDIAGLQAKAPDVFRTADAALCLRRYSVQLTLQNNVLVLLATPTQSGFRAFCISDGKDVDVWKEPQAHNPLAELFPERYAPQTTAESSPLPELRQPEIAREIANIPAPVKTSAPPTPAPTKKAVEIPPAVPDLGDPADVIVIPAIPTMYHSASPATIKSTQERTSPPAPRARPRARIITPEISSEGTP